MYDQIGKLLTDLSIEQEHLEASIVNPEYGKAGPAGTGKNPVWLK